MASSKCRLAVLGECPPSPEQLGNLEKILKLHDEDIGEVAMPQKLTKPG